MGIGAITWSLRFRRRSFVKEIVTRFDVTTKRNLFGQRRTAFFVKCCFIFGCIFEIGKRRTAYVVYFSTVSRKRSLGSSPLRGMMISQSFKAFGGRTSKGKRFAPCVSRFQAFWVVMFAPPKASRSALSSKNAFSGQKSSENAQKSSKNTKRDDLVGTEHLSDPCLSEKDDRQ